MRIHHLNCGSLVPISPNPDAQPDRPDPDALPAVCHCLLLETDDGLVLVDTGLGTEDVREPEDSLGADWVAFARPALIGQETALAHVERLGFSASDVRHVVLTHLHRDHTGGLPDFPHATVHVHPDELRAVTNPSADHHRASLERYMPAHRAHGPRLVAARPVPDETWFGIHGVSRPRGVAADLLLVPLPGHSAGHAGVAVRTDDGRWLLHAGDAYLFHGEVDDEPARTHPLLALVQENAQTDEHERVRTRDRLRDLQRRHPDELTVFCAHDPWELRQLASGA